MVVLQYHKLQQKQQGKVQAHISLESVQDMLPVLMLLARCCVSCVH